jgi:Ribosomal RNA-processing protein 7 (RRP7) C-terminal domain
MSSIGKKRERSSSLASGPEEASAKPSPAPSPAPKPRITSKPSASKPSSTAPPAALPLRELSSLVWLDVSVEGERLRGAASVLDDSLVVFVRPGGSGASESADERMGRVATCVGALGEVRATKSGGAEGSILGWPWVRVWFAEGGAGGGVPSASALAALAARQGEGEEGAGLRGWLAEAEGRLCVPEREIAAEAERVMAEFEAREADVRAQRKALGAADADGFVLVTRPGGELGRETVGSRATRRKAKKDAVMSDSFYAFQKQDRHLERMRALRAKFEEDKDRVRRIKRARKFNPS